MAQTPLERLRDEGYELVYPEPKTYAFPFDRLAEEIRARKRLVVLIATVGLALSLAYGLIHKTKYTAAVLLMPPDPQALTTTSALAALSGNPLAGGLGGGGGLLSTRTPGSTVIGILGSRTVLDHMIDKFGLMAEYRSRYRGDARLALTNSTEMAEDKKSGLLSIAVTDVDAGRARDMANEYVAELNAALTAVNSSSAHRERLFLEERLRTLKAEMDQLAKELSRFSSETATLNPQAQGQALFESAGKLEGELVVAEAELSSLQATYNDENVRVKAAKARVSTLRTQLAMLGGSAKGGTEQSKSSELFPSIRELPIVGLTYTNLSQQLTAEQGVYATLTRQYEIARVEEAKEIPSARLLDGAITPEKPSTASVLRISVLGTLLFGFLGVLCAIGAAFWSLAPSTMPLKGLFQFKSSRREV